MSGCANCCQQCLGKLCTHKVPLFSTLGHADLVRISQRIVHREYSKGSCIFLEGEKPEFIVIMNEGSAKAYKITPDGREQILYMFSDGDFFGEQYLLGDQTAAYHVEALTPVKACLLHKKDFQQLLRDYPDIAIRIIEVLGVRLARLEEALRSIGVRSVDARVGTLLLEYADKYTEQTPDGPLIRLPLSREGMANTLGIARETVSRKLTQLEGSGVLRIVGNKSLLLLNRAALEELAGVIE